MNKSTMKIGLKRASVNCIMGCEPFEREKEQEILVDFEYVLEKNFTRDVDDIRHTISYVDVFHEIDRLLKKGSFYLLEVAASTVSQSILSIFPQMKSFTISLIKTRPIVEIHESYVEYTAYNQDE